MSSSKKPPADPRTYATRKRGGRPIISLTMSEDTVELLRALAERLHLSRAAVVELALRELAKRR